MVILGIETSCDDTAISVVKATGDLNAPKFEILSSLVSSQVKLHAEWGGVVPMLAKREHEHNLPPLLIAALREANVNGSTQEKQVSTERKEKIIKRLEREPELLKEFIRMIIHMPKPAIDVIAVTYGPGLEPALWSGINFAESLGLLWDIPIIPTNHMEGHVVSTLLDKPDAHIEFPMLGLLVSGGHTEIALITSWTEYKILAETRDDAAGEAFDKVARILGLPYPGGPEIDRLAALGVPDPAIRLPRPMLHSPELDFSFSGLKTAVLYLVKSLGTLSEEKKASIAREFVAAVTEVLVTKVDKALTQHQCTSFIMGGGVTASTPIRTAMHAMLAEKHPDVHIFIPEKKYTTDNAAMIAAAAYFRIKTNTVTRLTRADGGLRWE